jgi:L-arabinokinase
MQASHESYSACGLGSAATDRLVELVRARGVGEGLFGARITGGGSGGTVAVLGSATAGPVVDEIAAVFAREAGHRPHVFSGSSPGAAGFGHLVVR